VANQFFACSKDAAISRYGRKVGDDAEHCQVLNNAIDTGKFVFHEAKKQQMRQQLHIAESALVIGHVGRFVDAKNHLFLIDIFQELHKRDSNSVLLLVGDGELRAEIERKIQTVGLTDAVIMTGVQSNTYDYYQAMDVFVMPSHYEGLPVSLVEAQTAGLPCCVSSAVPVESAITELVQEGWLYRIASKGTFVARSKIKQDFIKRLETFNEQIARTGRKPGTRLLALELGVSNNEHLQAVCLKLHHSLPRCVSIRRAYKGKRRKSREALISSVLTQILLCETASF
jgi:glycosyltransferase involved in cell wall biosynthesis